MHAPHICVAVVTPGHVGTDIVVNTRRVLGRPELEDMSDAEVENWRPGLIRRGAPADASTEDLRRLIGQMSEDFKETAPLGAAEAASTILEGIREGRWRILVGRDAEVLDARVRREPETAYEYPRIGGAILEYHAKDNRENRDG